MSEHQHQVLEEGYYTGKEIYHSHREIAHKLILPQNYSGGHLDRRPSLTEKIILHSLYAYDSS